MKKTIIKLNKMIKVFKDLYEISNNKNIPAFNCTNEGCTGKLEIENPLDL